jgi:hypothetical protein
MHSRFRCNEDIFVSDLERVRAEILPRRGHRDNYSPERDAAHGEKVVTEHVTGQRCRRNWGCGDNFICFNEAQKLLGIRRRRRRCIEFPLIVFVRVCVITDTPYNNTGKIVYASASISKQSNLDFSAKRSRVAGSYMTSFPEPILP